jgi:hypothetical protein
MRDNKTTSSICQYDVKKVFKCLSHKKCYQRGQSFKVKGQILNTLASKSIFDDNQSYSVCRTLHRRIESSGVQFKLYHPPIIKRKNTESISSEVVSRELRNFRRNRIPVRSLSGIKSIMLKIGDDDDTVIDVSKKRYKPTVEYSQKVLDDKRNYFRVPYGELKMRSKRERMDDLAALILGACANRTELRKDGMEYLYGNETLAIDISCLLDGIREQLLRKMKVRLADVEGEVNVPLNDDREGLIQVLDEKKHQFATSLLGETSRNGFQRLMSKFNDAAVDGSQLPSYYRLTKDNPKIEEVTLQLNHQRHQQMNEQVDIDAPVVGGEGGQQVSNDNTPVEIDVNTDDDTLMRLVQSSDDVVKGAKIEGGYSDYYNILQRKHKNLGRQIEKDEECFVIDSIDGAEHLKSKKKITSVISFSSFFCAPSWINNDIISAGSSLNILTWQQLQAAESNETMMHAVKDYLQSKKELRDSMSSSSQSLNKCHFYDLHDGKMLYLLTQHSMWNRKHHPFVSCSCRRGDGVRNNANHICSYIGDDSAIYWFERSERRWKNKQIRVGEDKYSRKDHLDWVDVNNCGISHFGAHPNVLPRENLRYDTFHMKCAITRKMMTWLRSFILNQSYDIIEHFSSSVLKSFWNDFHLLVWNNKKSFSSFQGNEIAVFVGNTDGICNFLQTYISLSSSVTHLINALKLWKDIFKLLSVTKIDERQGSRDWYLAEIDEYENKVKNFYDIGSKSFLTSNHNDIGNEESFYFHTLRYYIPRIARITFDRHKLGVGIFTMQGFERRNKESKNCMKRFNNYKANMTIGNLDKLYNVFNYNCNNV